MGVIWKKDTFLLHSFVASALDWLLWQSYASLDNLNNLQLIMNQTTSGQLFDSQTALVSKLFNFWDALDPKI